MEDRACISEHELLRPFSDRLDYEVFLTRFYALAFG